MNWNPTHEPNSAIAARFARTSGPERRMPRRINGDRVRSSRRTNAASSTPAAANDTRVLGEIQPTDGASTSVNTSRSMAAVIRMRAGGVERA